MTDARPEDAAVPVVENSGGSRGLRRFGWGLGDQLVSSATNVLLGLLIARSVNARDFGAFSLVYATFTLSLGAVRALAGELLVVRYSSVPLVQWASGVKAAAGAALSVGIVVGIGCLIAGSLVQGPVGLIFPIIGVSLPILLVQDTWRFALFARGRGAAAFLNDLSWGVLMLGAFVLLMSGGQSSVAWFTIAWAGAGCIAALLGSLQLRVFPSGPGEAFRWLRGQRDLAPRFLAEFAVSSGSTNLTLFGMSGLMGLAELGRLRAGQIAMGPVNILFGGAGLVTVPEGVRLLHESPRRLARSSAWLSAGLAIAALLWGGILLVLPDDAGRLLLGTNWEAARSILIPLSLGAASYGITFGAMAGLRSLAAGKRSLRARYVDALSLMLFSLGGAWAGGAVGAAWGGTVAACFRVPNAWWQFSRALREYESALEARTGIDPTLPPAARHLG